jgi:hypothetical protein
MLPPGRQATEHPSLSALEVWRTLLCHGIEARRHCLPSELIGTIQLEVHQARGEPEYFHINVEGPKTDVGDGLALEFDAFVSTSEQALGEVLYQPGARPGALKVSGRMSLVEGLLSGIAGKGESP